MNKTDSAQIGRWGGWFASSSPFSAKLRIIDLAAATVRSIGGNEREVHLWENTKFSVDLSDRIQRQMWFGCYEQHITQELRWILRTGDTFLDIGAHIGYHSHFVAGLVGPSGKVFAFEADPGNFARLKKNLQFFPYAQAYHCAIWSQEEKLLFERSGQPKESGWGKIASRRASPQGEQIEVSGISLDTWSLQVGLRAVRAAKIDVEGAELAVLLGSKALLQRMRPFLLLELNEVVLKQAGTSAAAIERLLRERGYTLRTLGHGPSQPWRVPSEGELIDCLAVPEESLSDLLTPPISKPVYEEQKAINP